MYTCETRKNHADSEHKKKYLSSSKEAPLFGDMLVSPTPSKLQDNVRVQVGARPSTWALDPTSFATREGYRVLPPRTAHYLELL